jgi:hypothetical protein
MKISHRISSLKRRNQNFNIGRDVDQINNNEDFINVNNYIDTSSSSSPHSNNYQVLGFNDNNHPLESNSSWRIPAILGLVWTTVILFVVFVFIMKKTILSESETDDSDQLPETNPENEWMIASFDNSDSDNIEVPLSTNISRDTIDNN